MASKSSPAITLYRGWNTPTQYVWSPFVTKVEFRLRTSHTPYAAGVGGPRSGPRGKIPYLEIGPLDAPAELLSDSAIILKTLSERAVVTDVNEGLSGLQKGQDLAVRALFEDRLYFLQGRERWVNNYYIMRDHALWSIPYPMRVVIGLLAYRANVRKLYEQGSGRFSDAETRALIRDVWAGVSGMLEESRRKTPGKDCFWVLGGEEPTEADATVFGFVVSNLVCDAAPETRKLLKDEFPVVVEYAERIHGRWFPEYEMWR
jgi:glutathione S-transferase